MYSVERDANTETSRNRGQKNVQDLNPDHIIVEIDQLEARVRDSRRMLQQERDSVLQLTKIKTRNEEEGNKLADEIIHFELEERKLQERERFLIQACCSAEQSMCLLMQLETQARTKLNEEINVTITKENELKRQLETYTVATVKVQEGFDRQGDSQHIKKLQCEIEKKTNLLNLFQKQIDNKGEEKANFEHSKIKDIQSWMEFKKLCVSFSEEWLKWEGDKKFLEKLENDKASLENELYSSSANYGNNCSTLKEMPLVRNEPLNGNVQRSKYENKVYDCEKFDGKETESYEAQDMDIVLPTDQDVVKLPAQPTPKSRNRQVKLGTSLLGAGFPKNILKKPMTNSKDVKRSEFTFPKLPGLHSVKSKKEQNKLEANKFQEFCTEKIPKLPELHSKVNSQKQNVLKVNKLNQSCEQNLAGFPVENKQKLNTLETTKLQQLHRENYIENGLSELQHLKTPKKIDQNAQILKVSSHKKSLKLGLSLELPKLDEKRSSIQFIKERINGDVGNGDNISESKTIQGEVDIDDGNIIKNNDAISDMKSILNNQMFSATKKSDTQKIHSQMVTAVPNMNLSKEKTNGSSINISVTKMAQSGNMATPQESTKVLGNVSPGTAFCDSKRKERLQELLASPKPTLVTNSAITKNDMMNSTLSQMKRDAPKKKSLMENFTAHKSPKISESYTTMAPTGNMTTPSVIKRTPTKFNVSPGTALCDIKRNEKLKKLLASPEPTPAMKSMFMFDPRSMQNHHKPDKMANLVKSKPPTQQSRDKGSTDPSGDHILSPMRSRIQHVNLKNDVFETNTKKYNKSKISTKQDSGSLKSKYDGAFDIGESSFDFMDKDKIEKPQDEQICSHKQNIFSIEESTSNSNKSDIFDIGKSNFDFTDKADENQFSMNFDVSTNSNFQFANFDFRDEENMENNDNSFSFNFGETSDEPKKKDNFSLF